MGIAVHLRFDEGNSSHQRMTIFVNGKHCGQLCLSANADAAAFEQLLHLGARTSGCATDTFKSSGKPWLPKTNDD